jgi:two-component system cell cycle sensor histidine kinase/response regulator CckA
MTSADSELQTLALAVLGLTTDCVLLIEHPSLRVLKANDALCRRLGYDSSEITALTLYDLAVSDPAGLDERVAHLLERGELFLGFRPCRAKDGSTVLLESSVSRCNVGGRTLLCVVARDPGPRQQAEVALRDRAERYRTLADAAFEGLAVTKDGFFVDANERLAEMLGTSLERLPGRPVSDFVAPEERERVSTMIKQGIEVRYEHAALRADGTRLPVEVQGRTWMRAGVPVRVTALRDITERLQLEKQVQLSQRMESVGRLAGGVAHDFNNLITVIISSAHAIEEIASGGPVSEEVQQIKAAAERAAELTGQLLSFARRQVVEPRSVRLNDLVLAVEKMLRRVIREDVELKAILARELWTIRADPSQLEQVLMNLALNARDAMGGGGTLTIETRNMTVDVGYAATHPEIVPGDYVVMSVTDTGAGMDSATLARIFEPFFSTKGAAHGTGLGLATVYGIVKQAGGHVWVFSEIGKGTTFKVYLPRVDAVDATPRAASVAAPLGGHETLLVVEDNAMVRRVASRTLRTHGYDVLEAGDGEEALRIFESKGGAIDMLVTDVVMPRMSGKELADRLLALRPGLKVLFTSGYTENTIVHHGVVDAGVEFLPKPYEPVKLARKVREVLDKP